MAEGSEQSKSFSTSGSSHKWEHVAIAAVVLILAALGGHHFWSYVSSPTAESLVASVPAPKVLTNHTKEFEKPHIVKVTDGIHMAIGYAIANSIMIEAPEGVIIVDTTENINMAARVFQDFRKITSAPIKAIIYTHNHADHTYGTISFVEDPENLPDIWSYHTLPKQMEMVATMNSIHFIRAMRQFGTLLPDGAHINCGIGRYLRASQRETPMGGFLPPNKFLKDEEEDVIIAGLPVRLVHIPGETSDQMGVWIPEKRAFLCGDDLYRTFPNLYAVRGTPTRNVLEWANSVDKMRALRPEFLVPSHTQPLIGKDHIYDTLTQYRDGIQYVHDQTVRYMNQGYHPNDIVAKVKKLPKKLAENPFLYELYGTVEWSSKAVFSQYLGWFSGDITELSSLTQHDKAQKMIKLLGGISPLLRAARTALDDEDYQWALELSSYVFTLYPTHVDARSVRLEALKALASRQTSPNGRNYYLTVALEDHELIDNKVTHELKRALAPTLSPNQVWNTLKGRMMPEVCEDTKQTAVFEFTDTNKQFTLNIRHGILEVLDGATEGYDFKVSVAWTVWIEILTQVRSPFAAYMAGHLVVDGGITGFKGFMACFDTTPY